MKRMSLSLTIIFAAFTGCAGQIQEQTADPYTFDASANPERSRKGPLSINGERPSDNEQSRTIDFGKVKEGQVMEHAFILVNKSTKTLNIKNTGTSCGCTVLEVEKKILKPQESTVIKAKFDSKGYSGPTRQYIYVYTDDLDNPLVRYIIKADVIK